MLGPDTQNTVRSVVAEAVKIFRGAIDRDLAGLAEEVDEEIIQLLGEKIAVLMLADLVNDHPHVPYISVWQSGKADIAQVYMSPRVVDLLGYSVGEVKKIRYANLAGDRIVSFFEDQHRFQGKTVPRTEAETDRREEYLGNRLWKGFYRVRQKSGGSVWVMDKAVLTKFINEKGGNVVYVSEGILLEAEELMDKHNPDREDAYRLLTEYNQSESLIKHALAVEAVMRYFARKRGADEDKWGVIGLIHDLDYERFPDQHCKKTEEILRQHGWPEEYIRAVVSHGWGICSEVEPLSEMEKVLYAVDELTGLVVTSALVRPSKSVMDMKAKSVKKKWKDKRFAAGVDRSIIQRGCDMLGMELTELITDTIMGMRAVAEDIGLKGQDR